MSTTNSEELLNSVLSCNICSYYTCNRRDFQRHQSTKKHLLKVEEEMIASQMNEEEEKTLEPEPKAPLILCPPVEEEISDESQKTGAIKRKKQPPRPKPLNLVSKIVEQNQILETTNENIEEDNLYIMFEKKYAEDYPEETIYETIYTNPLLLAKEFPYMFIQLHLFLVFVYEYVMDTLFLPRS